MTGARVLTAAAGIRPRATSEAAPCQGCMRASADEERDPAWDSRIAASSESRPSMGPPTSSLGRQPGQYRFVVAAMLWLLTAASGLNMFSVSPVMPLIIEDYGVNRGTAGLLTSVVPLMHALLGLPCSLLVSRFRPKLLITLAALLASAPALSLLADSFYHLLALRFAYGMSLALLMPAVAPLLMQRFRPNELSLMNGMFIASLSVGVTISSFIVAPIAEAVGWKTALSLLGCAPVVAALSWQVLAREEKTASPTPRHLSMGLFWRVLRAKTTILVAAADAGPYALYTVALAWLPTFYHEVHGVSLAQAGSLMGILSMTGVASLLVASLLTLQLRHRKPFLLLPGMIAGFAGLGTFLLAGTPGVYVAIIAMGFVSWFYLPALFTIPMELPNTDAAQVAVTYGALLSVGSVFTFIAPLTVGITTDLLGSYVPGLALFSALSWSLLVAGYLLPETGRGREQPS